MLRIALLLIFLYGYSTIAPTVYAAPPAKSAKSAKPSTAKPPPKKAPESKAKTEAKAKADARAKAKAEEAEAAEADAKARAEAEAAAKNFVDDILNNYESSSQPSQAETAPPPPVPPPTYSVPQAQPIPLDSIPMGFSSQLKKNQPPPVSESAPPVPELVSTSKVSSSSIFSSSSVAPPPPPPIYKFYADYLDSLVIFARNVLPSKHDFESKKALINEEVPGPKGQYEKRADYDYRIANFDKEKEKRIRDLEKKYKADEKIRLKKLEDAINYKPDIQPEWSGLLKQDADVDGYHLRTVRFTDKISYMKKRATDVMEILAGLELLSKSDLETLNKKNRICIARLERGIELMQDYILQEYAEVKSTGKKKYDMSLGTYDPEKEQFQVNMSDIYSRTVPFDFVGFVKVPPQIAEEVDRKTDDFLGSVEYINYPFMLNGEALYPGAKNANFYYKGQAVSSVGGFRNVGGFEYLEGYIEWATYADSLISGKLAPRNLDSSYAMKNTLPKVALAGTWWSRNESIVRGTLFALSALSAGVAIWQNFEVKSNTEKARGDYNKAINAINEQNEDGRNSYSQKYKNDVKNVRSSEGMRSGFYIIAGVFGVAGIVSFYF
jgi:hypothetical protein